MAREMKDSGVEWIGDIPNGWNITRNKFVMVKEKQICPIYKNQDVLSLTQKGVIVRDLDNPTGKMPTSFDGYQYIHKGNLLMCLFDIDVTPRCIGLIKDDGITSPAYSQFIVNHGFANYYYYYYLMLDFSKELLHLAKNLRYSLTEELLGFVPVPFPPLEEQKNISNFLDKKCSEIDNLTAEIEKQISLLEDYKKSIITGAVTKGLNPNVEFKDSGIEWIGKIPKHWEITKIKNLGNARNGLTYSPSNLCDENSGTLVLRSSNIKNGKLSFDDNVFVNCLIKNNLKVKKGDILICSRNGSAKLIGKSALIDRDLNSSFGAFMMIFRSKLNTRYIKYILESDVFKFNLSSYLTSTINQLTNQNFSNMKIVFCNSEKEQKEIVDFLDKKCSEIDSLISDKKEQLEKLASYKQSMIYEYVTGKKEIPTQEIA